MFVSLYRFVEVLLHHLSMAQLTLTSRVLHVAGKDRTAVIAAIFLTVRRHSFFLSHVSHNSANQLAGVDPEVIAYDYELTRIGREPIRDRIMKRLLQEPIFAANKDAALNMLSSRCVSNAVRFVDIHTCLLYPYRNLCIDHYFLRFVALADVRPCSHSWTFCAISTVERRVMSRTIVG